MGYVDVGQILDPRMRDASMLWSWSWDTFNVPERIALALAIRGARVLYCEIPASPIQAEGASS